MRAVSTAELLELTKLDTVSVIPAEKIATDFCASVFAVERFASEVTVALPTYVVIPLNALFKSEAVPCRAVVAPLEDNVIVPLVAALIAFSCAK